MDEPINNDDVSDIYKANLSHKRTDIDLAGDGTTQEQDVIGDKDSFAQQSDNKCAQVDNTVENNACHYSCEQGRQVNIADNSLSSHVHFEDAGDFKTTDTSKQLYDTSSSAKDGDTALEFRRKYIVKTDSASLDSSCHSSVAESLMQRPSKVSRSTLSLDLNNRGEVSTALYHTSLGNSWSGHERVNQLKSVPLSDEKQSSGSEAGKLGSSFGGLIIKHSCSSTTRRHSVGDRQLAKPLVSSTHTCVTSLCDDVSWVTSGQYSLPSPVQAQNTEETLSSALLRFSPSRLHNRGNLSQTAHLQSQLTSHLRGQDAQDNPSSTSLHTSSCSTVNIQEDNSKLTPGADLQPRPPLDLHGESKRSPSTRLFESSPSASYSYEDLGELIQTARSQQETAEDSKRQTESRAIDRFYTCVCDKKCGLVNKTTNLNDTDSKSTYVCSLLCLSKNKLFGYLGCSAQNIRLVNDEICLHSRLYVDGVIENRGVSDMEHGRQKTGRLASNGESVPSNASDDVFRNRAPSVGSSNSDINSLDSLVSNQSALRDTATSRMRYELRHASHPHGNDVSGYLTPSQRKDREIKDLKREIAQLLREKEERDSEILSLKCAVAEERRRVEEEKDRQIAELTEKLKTDESERFEDKEEICKARAELAQMDERYTTLKRQMSEQEEKYEEYLLDMYKKGQQAAMFEREEELEMLASNKKSRVSLKELTRKLSRTEMELAKWQGLKLGESYSRTEPPETQADVTLQFLKDAFFHFLSDSSDNEDHLRAILKIFKFSDVQMGKIWKGLEEFKNLDRKRLLKKKDGT